MVTHDIDEAVLLSDRILFMKDKKIRKEFTVDFERPRSRQTIFDTDKYRSLRHDIIELFYENITDNIGNEEVDL